MADTDQLMHVWNVHNSRTTWQAVLRTRDGADAEVARRALAELPEVTAVDALHANRELVDLLTGRRWYVMRDAREAGATWAQIGSALGMTKQGAQDFYRRRLADQERHAPEVFDRQRAEAVIVE